MNIKTTTPTQRLNQAKPAAGASPSTTAEQTPEAEDKVVINIDLEPTNLINKGAYGAGGAVAGLGLGVVTGSVLGTLSGVSSLSTIGGAVGVLGGAATALAASGTEDPKQALTEMGLSWGAGSVGALGGLYLVGGGLALLGDATGTSWLRPIAPILGTVAGGVAASGAAAGIGGESELSKNLATAGSVSALGTAGLVAGTAAQGIMTFMNSSLGPVATLAPVVGAAVGGGGGFALAYDGEHADAVRGAAATGLGATAGYAAGMILGGAANGLGGSSLYALGAPLAGAAIGGLLTRGEGSSLKNSNIEQKLAVGGLTAVGGTLAGDLIGHGMTWVTGHGVYGQIGAIAGMVNGGLFGAELSEVGGQHARRAVFGTTAGVVGGAALGSALTALTGQGLWSTAAPILGAAAGGLGALSQSINTSK